MIIRKLIRTGVTERCCEEVSRNESQITRQRRKYRTSQGEHRRVMGFVVHLANLWPHTSRHRDEVEPVLTATTFVASHLPVIDTCNYFTDNNSLLKCYHASSQQT